MKSEDYKERGAYRGLVLGKKLRRILDVQGGEPRNFSNIVHQPLSADR